MQDAGLFTGADTSSATKICIQHYCMRQPMPRAIHRGSIASSPADAQGRGRAGGTFSRTGAIRYAELTRTAAAIIVSTGQRVDYCRLSEGMKELKGIQWVKKGAVVASETETARFNNSPDLIAKSERRSAEIDIRSWLGGTRSLTALEEVVGLGSYGRTPTVLTCQGVEEQRYGYEDGSADSDDRGQRFRSIADSGPMIPDSS